jgi:hypothetical protein
MDKHNRHLPVVLAGVALLAGSLCVMAFRSPVALDDAQAVGRPAKMHPDYSGTVIPPNIAPLNFLVEEKGARYIVRIRSGGGRAIEITSRSARIAIPEKPWHKLLDANRGQPLSFEVFVQPGDAAGSGKDDARRWQRFDTVSCTVANENIDSYLVYRRIHPVHAAHREMGIYQRDLRHFDESCVLNGGYFSEGCVNCHTFCNNRTDRMLISTRTPKYTNAAIVVINGTAKKIGATFGYSSWHPSGKILTYSMNKVVLFHHSVSDEARDVMDLDSLIAYYVVGSQTIETAPDLSRKDRLETYPTWSPDGRFLYFCSAPLTWTDRTAIPQGYKEIRYDLMRIAYDADRDEWGPLETVLSAKDTGRSVLLPRISPDGRWLLFCMCEYGCFPVYQRSSDLYVIDLEAAKQTGRFEHRRLDINSDQSESWHSWSSNGRWIAFSSKRGSGVFTRTYLSYVDPNGTAHKPLLLPQKDPTHYDSCLWTYSVPELVTSPVQVTKESLGRVVRSSDKISVQIPVTTATPKAGPVAEPYMSTRE